MTKRSQIKFILVLEKRRIISRRFRHFCSLYLDRFTGGRSGWLFVENHDIHNLGSIYTAGKRWFCIVKRAAREE